MAIIETSKVQIQGEVFTLSPEIQKYVVFVDSELAVSR